MDSIRDCTESCFRLFDQWLGGFPTGSDELAKEAHGNNNAEPAVLHTNNPGYGIQDLHRRTLESTKTDGSRFPRDNDSQTIFVAERVEDRVTVENHLFRFRLWAEHNSALSKRHDSLDWRLRKSTMAHSVMIDLLKDLSHAILSTSAHLLRDQN